MVERDEAVLEDDLRGVARADAELLLLAAHLQAGRALRHEEGGDAGGPLGRIGVRVDDVVVGDAAVGAELLGAVEHIAVAHARRASLHRKGVRPRVGLGEAEAAEHQLVRIGELRQPASLLLIGAAGANARDGERHRLDANRDPGTSPVQLFIQDQLGEEVEALAAVLLGQERGRSEAELVRPVDHLVWKLLALVVTRGHRADLVDREVVRELADGLLLGRQREIERQRATKGTRPKPSSGSARRAG